MIVVRIGMNAMRVRVTALRCNDAVRRQEAFEQQTPQAPHSSAPQHFIVLPPPSPHEMLQQTGGAPRVAGLPICAVSLTVLGGDARASG